MAATESSTRAMAALDDLYRRHVGDVYRYTYAVLGNHADAEDVTQTTFVNALRALERGETPREASHWLLAIAHNLVRQRWRQAAARPTMVELVHDVPDEAPEEDIALDELVRALQRIPPSQREALVMRELEGRSYKEIAELLGLSTTALETLLFRARRSLAEELENLVTCQTAEHALSRQSDGRLSRKERKRLEAHVAECASCARFARTQAWQRKAFKGLAVLPVPVGLSLFRDASVASAATLPTIGGTSTSAGGGAGAAGTGSAVAGSSLGAGGTVAGGSLIGAAAIKVAVVVAAATVVVGVGYQGVNVLRDGPAPDAATTKDAGSVVAPGAAAEGSAPLPRPADTSSRSLRTGGRPLAAAGEVGDATAHGPADALSPEPDGAVDDAAANSDAPEVSGSRSAGKGAATGDSSSDQGEPPGAAPTTPPAGSGPAEGGDTSMQTTPAAATAAQPTPPTATATPVPMPSATKPKRAKKTKPKPATAKGPKGKTSTRPVRGGKPADAPGKQNEAPAQQKEPAAGPPPGEAAPEAPATDTAPPAPSETAPAASETPTVDGGDKHQGWSPDAGKSAAAPGHNK